MAVCCMSSDSVNGTTERGGLNDKLYVQLKTGSVYICPGELLWPLFMFNDFLTSITYSVARFLCYSRAYC